jgi:hypothetical protein
MAEPAHGLTVAAQQQPFQHVQSSKTLQLAEGVHRLGTHPRGETYNFTILQCPKKRFLLPNPPHKPP